LNPLGINCLRSFPNTSPVAWGARTLAAGAAGGSDGLYVSVRRLTIFVELSISAGI
jgi:hypothetical protein